MSRELLQAIQRLNQRNHALLSDTRADEDGPPHLGQIDEIQRGIAVQVRQSIDDAIRDFETRLGEHTGRDEDTERPPLAGASELVRLCQSLEETLEDLRDRREVAPPSGWEQILDLPGRLEEVLQALSSTEEGPRGVAGAVDHDSVDNDSGVWETRLREVADQVAEHLDERWTQLRGDLLERAAATTDPAAPSSGGGSAEILGELDAIRTGVEELRDTLRQGATTRADEGTSGEVEGAGEAIRSALERLTARVEEIGGGGGAADSKGLAGLESRLAEKWRECVDQLRETAKGGHPTATDEQASLGPLERRLSELEERLVAAFRECPDKASLVGAPAPDPAPPIDDRLEAFQQSVREALREESQGVTQTLLDRCLELEHTIPEMVQAHMGAVEGSESHSAREIVDVVRSLVEGNSVPAELVELPELVLNLRKDFSLLVHTINSHLEETRELSGSLTSSVEAALDILRDGAGEPATRLEAAAEHLEKVLAGIAGSTPSANGSPTAHGQ